MALRRILLVGSGERVRQAALPVFQAAEGFEVAGIVSRKPKTIWAAGREWTVRGLASLTREQLSEIDLIYMVVKKPAVPVVLRQLALCDLGSIDLLIETPVLLIRHLGHRSLLAPFRNVWVSEDCEPLPCLDALKSLARSGALGELKSATLDRSGYAYHGLAMIKSLLGGGTIRSARQRALGAGLRERTVTLANGLRGILRDPRDYALGSISLEGTRGWVTDAGEESGSHFRLEAIAQGGNCTGFRAGHSHRELSEPERLLMGSRGAGQGVTAWMDGMKRVGFLGLMHRIQTGAGAYPLASAIENSVVDYSLEKLGRYRSTPLTQPEARLARLGFSLLTKIVDR